MPPTILNVVVDSVVHQCISLVSGGAGGQDRWGREVLHRTAFFYAYYGLVALMHLLWLQGLFDTLTRFFDRVGLQTNVEKTVLMIFHPCRTVGTQLKADCE